MPGAGELPLFPLQTVLFPDGLLALKVFEARYLDLIGRCLRERSAFGVVGLKRGGEVRRTGEHLAFEAIGTTAELIDVDSAQAGILLARCRGGARFEVGATRCASDGLWLARGQAGSPRRGRWHRHPRWPARFAALPTPSPHSTARARSAS